jgi:hypothetical protein
LIRERRGHLALSESEAMSGHDLQKATGAVDPRHLLVMGDCPGLDAVRASSERRRRYLSATEATS